MTTPGAAFLTRYKRRLHPEAERILTRLIDEAESVDPDWAGNHIIIGLASELSRACGLLS